METTGERVYIFDTTLRDGEQSPGASMNPDEKLRVARQLERMGVDIIEAGFPVASDGDFDSVRQIAAEIRGCQIAALARANLADIDRAWEAVGGAANPRIHTFISSSDIHLEYQLRKSREQVLQEAVAAVAHASRYTKNVEFSPMDATRSDRDYLCQMVEATIAAGATTINIPDTVGYAVPAEFGDLIATLFAKVKNIRLAVISVHCHNDLGLATANALQGVRYGARQVECTINGIGERAGNTALEEVVMALRTRRDNFGVDTAIDTQYIYSLSRMVSDLTGIVVQPNKSIVGRNAFAHSSGIHQDGVLKERTTYEIIDPRAIGVPESEIILSARSGRHGLRHRLEQLGYVLDDKDAFEQIYERFLALADKKKTISDRDLEAIVADEVRIMDRNSYVLEQVQVSCGSHSMPTATVRLATPEGTVKADAAIGAGPVDAVYQAINRVIGVPNELIEFAIKAVTEGIDAIGEVTIRIRSDGHVFTGRGADTDIIVASAKAYMNALNRLIAIKREDKA